jgi:hypothetical protein
MHYAAKGFLFAQIGFFIAIILVRKSSDPESLLTAEIRHVVNELLTNIFI